MDGVAVGFDAVGEGGVGGEGVGAAEGSLVAGGDVVVFVDGGLVGEEDEEVGVAAVAIAGGGLLAQLLLNAGEPAFGALPRWVRAVEEIRAVGTVAGGEEDVGCAGLGGEPGLGRESVRGVVTVGDEAVGGVAAGGELFGEPALRVGGA